MFKFVVLALCFIAVSCEVTPAQRQIIQDTWAPYQANGQQTGTQLFAGFLSKYPEIKAQFPKLKDVAAADLVNNADLQAHALKIYNVVNDVITTQNYDNVVQLSQFHKQIGQTNQAYFNTFRQYFIDYLNVNAEQAAAWNAGLDKFFTTLYSQF